MEFVNPTKEYRHEKHMIFSCQYHVVFTPKYRRSVLIGDIAKRLEILILEKCNELNAKVLDMVIQPDHVHLLLDVDPSIGIYSVISQIKGYTAKKLREEFPELKSKLPSLWTRGKFISTVGNVNLNVVRNYIESQKGV